MARDLLMESLLPHLVEAKVNDLCSLFQRVIKAAKADGLMETENRHSFIRQYTEDNCFCLASFRQVETVFEIQVQGVFHTVKSFSAHT